MRKQVLFLCLATWLCTLGSVHAQIRYGLKGSFLLASISSDNPLDANIESRPGFALGGLGEFSLSKNFSVSAELQFSLRGYHYDRSYRGSQIDYLVPTSVRLGALRLPVALAFQTKGFFLSAGPYVGLALFGKAKQLAMDSDHQEFEYDPKVKFTGSVEPNPDSYDYNKAFLGEYNTGTYPLRRLEAGLLGNLGYGSKKVRITGFYDFGLNNTLPEYVRAEQNFAVKNRAFGASVTYFLGIRE